MMLTDSANRAAARAGSVAIGKRKALRKGNPVGRACLSSLNPAGKSRIGDAERRLRDLRLHGKTTNEAGNAHVYSSSRMIRILGTTFAGLLGLAFGSFLNVCLSRWPEQESVIEPRSHCRRCGHVLAWWENIPVASWLGLRGRCRACRGWIGWRYPLVEALVGALWAMAAWRAMSFPLDSVLSLAFGLSALAMGIGQIDFELDSGGAGGFRRGAFLASRRVYVSGNPRGAGAGSGAGADRGTREQSLLGAAGGRGRDAFGGNCGVACPVDPMALLAGEEARRHWSWGRKTDGAAGRVAGTAGSLAGLWTGGGGRRSGGAAAAGLAARRREAGSWAASKLPLGTFLCIGGVVSAFWGQPLIAGYLRWAGF